jgi:coiled-coil and C2 domain-containing protein 1
LDILLERQRLFKEAALAAKQAGAVEQALLYLKQSKGFDSMILAVQSGLPVNMRTIPIPPQLMNSTISSTSSNKVVIDDTPISGDRKDVLRRLVEDLSGQVKTANSNAKHFQSIGDIKNANMFAQLAKDSRKDYDVLASVITNGERVPLYHYETRRYQTVDCIPEISENDLEINIVRAINLPIPKDFEAKHLDTYVKVDFPYPTVSVFFACFIIVLVIVYIEC